MNAKRPADESASESRDLLQNPRLATALFWLPAVALIVSGALAEPPVRTGIWAAALTTMGVACIVNARRCGRAHCFFTGPLFLAAAIVTLLYGIGLVPLGAHGWSFISLGIIAGTLALCCLPEMLFGKYFL